MVESQSDSILENADKENIAFLVVGDPFGATTHIDLSLRCSDHSPQIETRTIHNASILTALGSTGLTLYNYGQTVSMVFFTENWKPQSFYDRLLENHSIGLHSLILLDIKVKEPDLDLLSRTGRVRYEPPRFMSASQCCGQMLEVEEMRKEGVCASGRLAVAVARMGSKEEKIVAGTIKELNDVDMGAPLHSVILVGQRCSDVEWAALRRFSLNQDTADRAYKDGGYGKLDRKHDGE